MNVHQPMLNFEPSPEVQQHLLPEHQTPKENRWRRGLPPVQDGTPLLVDDLLRSACILTPQED